MDNDIDKDKSPSQWLLKIIAWVELIIAGLLSLSFLSMLFVVMFRPSRPPHGHAYLMMALMFLTPILLLL